MNDLDLLVFGCAVMFIAAAGAYVFARERFVYSDDKVPARKPRQTAQAVEAPALEESAPARPAA